jgi:hypothetical protein
VALFDLFHRRSGYLMSTLHLGEQATPVAGDHGVEVVDRRVHVHGPHAIDVTVGRGKGLDALLEFTPDSAADGAVVSLTTSSVVPLPIPPLL